MVGCPRPNRWLVEPDSTARFTQRALVRMKERTKALLSKNQNELSAARELYVSLDRADNVIEGGSHPSGNQKEFNKYKQMGEFAYIQSRQEQAFQFVRESPWKSMM